MNQVKSSFSNNTHQQALNKYTKPKLLIIDEIGLQYGSQTEQVILFEIINARYEQRLATIIISNLNLSGVTKFLGDRAVDRLKEDQAQVIYFNWGSYRCLLQSSI